MPRMKNKPEAKHYLKTWPVYFQEVLAGTKTFEVRNNVDRGFQKGDLVLLEEYEPNAGIAFGPRSAGDPAYTGRAILVEITYVTNYEQKKGNVVFAFKKVP